jgi:hypothetical protein
MADREIDMGKPSRGRGRELRIRLCEWQGRARIDVREWYEDEGTWKPGKGASIRANEIAAVASALDAASERVDRQGRIVDASEREEDPI